MVPLKKFSYRSKLVNAVRLPMRVDIVPVNDIVWRPSARKFVRLYSSSGIDPNTRWLSAKDSSERRVSRPTWLGMVPERLLSLRYNRTRFDNNLMRVDIVPESFGIPASWRKARFVSS